MAALIDSENFVMPLDGEGKHTFKANLWVTHDYKDESFPPCQAEVSIHVPPYLKGIAWGEKTVEYDSCGLLFVSLDVLIDEYIEDYWYGAESLDEVKFLRNTLQNCIDKLNAFIDKEELEINTPLEADNGA